MSVGIDEISFYTSNYFLDLQQLAEVRDIDVDKYYKGIGQEKWVCLRQTKISLRWPPMQRIH
ncbi:hypothetical protein [Aliamphritea spongicola]|nr:hypothetical protein [Aliamphritea spongicola]